MVTFVKYRNRKLYRRDISSYVNYQGIAELIRAGEAIEVYRDVDGVEITLEVLCSVLLHVVSKARGPEYHANESTKEFRQKLTRGEASIASLITDFSRE
jgi:hypothetical protein